MTQIYSVPRLTEKYYSAEASPGVHYFTINETNF